MLGHLRAAAAVPSGPSRVWFVRGGKENIPCRGCKGRKQGSWRGWKMGSQRGIHKATDSFMPHGRGFGSQVFSGHVSFLKEGKKHSRSQDDSVTETGRDPNAGAQTLPSVLGFLVENTGVTCLPPIPENPRTPIIVPFLPRRPLCQWFKPLLLGSQISPRRWTKSVDFSQTSFHVHKITPAVSRGCGLFETHLKPPG